MPQRSHPSPLTRSCIAALVGASGWSASAPAFAQAPAAPAASTPPGQKPPCVPASSYTLGYDCELFPLPALPDPAAAPAAPPAVVPVPGAAVAAPLPVAAVPATAVPAVPIPEGAPPAVPDITAATSTPVAPATSYTGPSHAPAYVAFAVGLGGIGMTVAFGILALQTRSTLNGECTSGNVCPSSAASDVSTLKTYADVADVGLGVAVAGVAVGAILFATEHTSSGTTGGRHLEPWIGLGAGGLKGTF